MPEGKKQKKNIKAGYHSFVSCNSNSKKQTWGTDQLPTQSEIKVFAVGPRRGLGANARVKRPEYALIVSFMGVCGRKSGGKVFLALKVSLWAMHEELKKQKREKQRTKAPEANIFMAIKTQYIELFLVVRFRIVFFRGGQRKLGPRPGIGLL